jgi:hypothetical protein
MGKPSGGVVGIWLDDHKLVEACKKVRLSGYKTFDAITPFPVHGIEEAIGIKRSIIPWVTFFAGLLGLTAGLSLTYWTSAISWALNIGGKPFFSGPAFMPIIFELTVLFAALLSVGAMFALVGLPKIDPPIIDKDLTSHKFAIFINDREPGYDAAKAEQLLKSLGAVEVRRIAEY